MGDRSLTAKEGGLTRSMRSSFADLCIKYDDVRNVDRMAAVQVTRFFCPDCTTGADTADHKCVPRILQAVLFFSSTLSILLSSAQV